MTAQNLFLFLFIIAFSSGDQVPGAKVSAPDASTRAKFEPADGRCILFVGQELEAIGGLVDYNDGYFDHFPTPGGFTMYSCLSPGDNSFGHVMKGLDGIWTTDNWGDGPTNISLLLADQDFKNSALAIGFSMVNHDGEIDPTEFLGTAETFADLDRDGDGFVEESEIEDAGETR